MTRFVGGQPIPRATKEEALLKMTEALKAAKTAKSLGVDVRPARPLMKQIQHSFMAGDSDEAIRIAEDVIHRFGGIPRPLR